MRERRHRRRARGHRCLHRAPNREVHRPLTDVVVDLEAEHGVLDDLVSSLGEEAWHTPTPAAGWDIADTIMHLAMSDEAAVESLAGRGRQAFADAVADPDSALARQAEEASSRTSGAILRRWREARTSVLAALRRVGPSERVYWGIGEMSSRSLATARLMECWAHGLDCFAALDKPVIDTHRIRHVCHLGYRTLPYAFQYADRSLPAPVQELRLELVAPDGRDVWHFGPGDAPQTIIGSAGEWARLCVRRLAPKDGTTLEADGPLAEASLEVAKAYLF